MYTHEVQFVSENKVDTIANNPQTQAYKLVCNCCDSIIDQICTTSSDQMEQKAYYYQLRNLVYQSVGMWQMRRGSLQHLDHRHEWLTIDINGPYMYQILMCSVSFINYSVISIIWCMCCDGEMIWSIYNNSWTSKHRNLQTLKPEVTKLMKIVCS